MMEKVFKSLVITTCIATLLLISCAQLGAQEASHVPVKNVVTSLGTIYCVDQDFLPSLETKISQLRQVVRSERAKGKFVGYISIPLSPAGGGTTDINTKVSAEVKQYLEAEYGGRIWMLAPGAEEATIPSVNEKRPRGQEYMYMWTEILAGEDGRGRDFDLFYFVGPSDFWRALSLTPKTSIASLQDLADKAGLDVDAKRMFVSYYAFRASATASKGAHDEWNMLRIINEKRRADRSFGIGSQIASYFDGHAVTIDGTEGSVSTGYEGGCQ